MAHQHPGKARRRRGIATLEMIMVLIVLILTTMVAFQFGTALLVKQAVSHAATVAAREAAKGAGPEELTEVITTILSPYRIAIGDDASFVLEDPQPTLVGNLKCSPPDAPSLDRDEVRVTVSVSLTARPILNLLEPYGVEYAGKTLQVSSVATREQ